MRDKLVGQIVGRKYRLDRLVAEGGMGAVYRATHLALEHTLAVKIVRAEWLPNPKVLARFRREARAIGRLAHPHIVRCFDFGYEEPVGAYLAMEWLDGVSLKDELDERVRLELDEAVRLTEQICSAVGAAHGASILHRDLKPGNIFLDEQSGGRVAKVLDFGLAKFLATGDVAATTELTAAGDVMGTASYMSPEQCEAAPLDHRSDLYSVACVFYKMVTGRPPFVNRNANKILVMHVREEPSPPSRHRTDVGPEMDAVVLRALAKAPSARYESAAELAAALRAALEPSVSPPSS